jgi:hypothetical protein
MQRISCASRSLRSRSPSRRVVFQWMTNASQAIPSDRCTPSDSAPCPCATISFSRILNPVGVTSATRKPGLWHPLNVCIVTRTATFDPGRNGQGKSNRVNVDRLPWFLARVI